MSVNTLIDRAAEKVGSAYKLSKALGVTPAQVYDWRDGRKPCSPADRARIAGFAAEDPVQELVRATLEKHEGTLRGEQLQQLLGKWSRATGEALSTVAVVACSTAFGMSQIDVLRCVLC